MAFSIRKFGSLIPHGLSISAQDVCLKLYGSLYNVGAPNECSNYLWRVIDESSLYKNAYGTLI